MCPENNMIWLQSINSPILNIDAKHESNDYLAAGYIYDCKDYDTFLIHVMSMESVVVKNIMFKDDESAPSLL